MKCLYKYYEWYNILLWRILNCYEIFEWELQRVCYCVIMNANHCGMFERALLGSNIVL